MGNGYDGPERRQEAQDWAMWRGRIDARVVALEATVGSLAKSHAAITRQQVRMEEQQVRMEEGLVTMRQEVAEAAKTIEAGREQSVEELKDTIRSSGLARAERVARRWQFALGFVVACLAPVVATLVTLWVTGK